MKNKKYSIRKFLTRIISIIIGIGTMKVGIVNAQMESNNKVVISEKGVIPDVEPILPEKLNNKVREALKYQRLRLFILLLDPHLTHTLKIYVFCEFFPNFFFLFFCYVSINTHCCF